MEPANPSNGDDVCIFSDDEVEFLAEYRVKNTVEVIDLDCDDDVERKRCLCTQQKHRTSECETWTLAGARYAWDISAAEITATPSRISLPRSTSCTAAIRATI